MNNKTFATRRRRDLLVVALMLAAGAVCMWRGLSPSAQHATPLLATTPVSLEPARDYEVVPQAIQTIRVGQRMWVEENSSGEQDERYGEEVIQAEWRKMVLRCPKRNGGMAMVELLRPAWWLEERNVRAGGHVEIEVPECGIAGLADILDVQPCPPIAPGPGRSVTATFHHEAAKTIDITLEGIQKPIGTTPNHPFWSETAQQFVRADQLQPGDEVRTASGTALIKSTRPRGPPEPVFNLEVHVDHVYHVASAGVLVHNGGLPILGNCPWQYRNSRTGQFTDKNGQLRNANGTFASGGDSPLAARGRQAHKNYRDALDDSYDLDQHYPVVLAQTR